MARPLPDPWLVSEKSIFLREYAAQPLPMLQMQFGRQPMDLWAELTHQRLYDATIDLCNRLHLEIPRKEITPTPAKEQG